MLRELLQRYGFERAELEELPVYGGTYLLVLRLKEDVRVRTKARCFEVRRGTWMYVGRAPRIASRVGRHLRGRGRKHWHIDYLLEHAEVLGVLVARGVVEEEVALALAGQLEHVPGFGCSDTSAPSHLFYLKNSSLQSILPGR